MVGWMDVPDSDPDDFRRWPFYFYPRPVLASGHCRCLRLSVSVSIHLCGNHEFVCAITHHPFKLESTNFEQRCIRPWLRYLWFYRAIDPNLQGQI